MNTIIDTHLPKNHIVLDLLRFNLQWYWQIMRDTLLRYKILILFITAILAPTLTSLLHLIIFPVQHLFSYPKINIISFSVSLIAYQIISVIWLMLHQVVVHKRPYDKYLISLPITNMQKMFVDISLLAVFDALMWVPLFTTSIILSFHLNGDLIGKLLITCKLLLYILLMLTLQISLVRQEKKIFLIAILINVLIITCLSTDNLALQLITTTILLTTTLTVLYFLLSTSYHPAVKNITCHRHQIKMKSFRRLFPTLYLQIINLRANLPQISMIIITLILMTLLSVFILTHSDNALLTSATISGIMLINALSASNLFKRLHTNWIMYDSFLTSLPIRRVHLFIINYAITCLSIFVFNTIIFIITILQCHSIQGDKVAIPFIMSFIFLALAYLPQTYVKRYGFFISFCLMSAMTSLTVLLII